MSIFGMQWSKEYRYWPLKRENVNIRLVQILEREEGREGDSIKCSIESVSLDENPDYTALSYTWGDPKVTKPILLDGKELHVTTNLHSAFVALRARGNKTRLWVDAISINQQDDDEKSWQVAQMLRIYQKATQVVVWLGPSADDSDNVLDIIEDVGREALNCGILNFTEEEKKATEKLFGEAQTLLAFGCNLPQGKPGTFENMLFRRFAGPDRPSDGIVCPPASLEALMSRSWWQRIWVLQEFSVARHVLFICGDKAVSGAVFEAGLIFFKMHANCVAKLDSNTIFIESLDIGVRGGTLDHDEDKESKRKSLEAKSRVIYDLDQRHTIFFAQRQRCQNNNRIHLLQLLLDISGLAHYIAFYATDPRDIIFALLGLSADADALDIRPDYTRSILQVYEQAAVALNKNMYDILPLCVGTDLEAAKRGEWPSWVPDWRKSLLFSKFNPLAGFQAGKGIPSLWIYDEREKGRLGVNYHIIDKVVEVEPLPLSSGQDFHITNTPHLMPPQFQSSILQAAEFAENRTVRLKALEDDNDAVWRTLIADQILLDLPEGVCAVRLGAGLISKQRDAYSAIVNQDLSTFLVEEISDLVQQCYEYMNDNVTPTDARIKIHEERDDGESEPKRFVSISPEKSTWLRNFAFTVKRMVSQRALITTETGLLCLGPANTEPGHIVALLNDLPTPYVICPVPEKRHLGPCGALVGQIYVHGLMNGVPDYRNLPNGVLDII